jgi:glycosyltransferase involved in cell wall biosynthesis
LKVSKRARILQVIDTLNGGGAERVAFELARRLDRSRFNVAVCVTRHTGLTASESTALQIPLYVLGRRGRFEGWFQFRRIIADFRPDVLHSHKEGSNTLARIIGIAERVPVMLAHEHCLPTRSFPQRLTDTVLARLGTHVVACGSVVGERLVRDKWIPPSRIHVVRNGIDTDFFRPQPAPVGAARAGSAGAIIGTIARLHVDKDLTTLLRAVPATLRHVPRARFVIAGSGPLQSRLEQEVTALGIADRVTLLGYRTDVRELLGSFDVFVLSSQSEGLPLVVLEAMSMGKPIVATSVGGVPEIVRDGVTGVLVPPKSPGALAAALISVLSDPAAAAMMGAAARAHVLRDHSLTSMVQATERLYENLLSARGRPVLGTTSARIPTAFDVRPTLADLPNVVSRHERSPEA